MRKILFTLLMVIASVTATAQTIGEAFYIYRNDGGFNAFFRGEVDSIAYSNYDADSIWYDDVVSQVVYTPDSTYFIPLAAIDSVGFVTPETVYQPGIKELGDDFKSHVMSVDSLTVHVSPSIPSLLLPIVGDKIVTTVMDDTFPFGFAGEVVSVDSSGSSIDIVCESVAIEDLFEVYYSTKQLEWDGNEVNRRTSSSTHSRGVTWKPGRLTYTLYDNVEFQNSFKKNDQLSFNLNEAHASISVSPTVYGNGIWIVHPAVGVHLSLTVMGDYDLEENYALKGGLTWQKDNSFFPTRIFWPILPLVDVYIDMGWFMRASGEFAIQQTWNQKYRSNFHWEYNSSGEELTKPVNKIIPISSDNNGMVAIDGEIGAGVFLEVGLDFIHTKKLDIANLHLRGEVGASLSGNFVLYNKELNEATKNTSAYERLRKTEIDFNWFYGLLFEGNLWKWDFSRPLPDFGNIKLNNQGKIFSFSLAPTFSDTDASLNAMTGELDALCKVSGPKSLLGNRCLPVDVGFWVKDDNLNTIGKSIVMKGFKGGSAIDVKKQFSGIPSGKQLTVYPYIVWMGKELLASPSCEVEENQSLCPDGNHPHAIDLELPSGTKWACCNVGASSPEGYGGYYAWGETSEKATYTWENYKYKMEELPRYQDLGSDIAGTSYDVAHVKWGGSWRMPSLEQILELLDNCTSKWTSVNGVNGREFTGPNGGVVFLPAAGDRWDGNLYDEGYCGYYWSSPQSPAYPYHLNFGSDYATWGWCSPDGRRDGMSVRPVSK